MPRSFTESERKYIKERLIKEAEKCLKLYGVRKTTVDELVKRVNIPKGTFYLFYESKERLFYEVLNIFHDELHNDIMTQIKSFDKPILQKQLTDLLFNTYKKIEKSFLYKIITNGDYELIMRKIPKEVIENHLKKDDFSLEQLLSIIPGIDNSKIEIFSATLRAIFLSMIHKEEIGEKLFEDALKLMINGVVIQMFGEDMND